MLVTAVILLKVLAVSAKVKILISILAKAWAIFSVSFLAGRPGNRAAIAGRAGAMSKRALL